MIKKYIGLKILKVHRAITCFLSLEHLPLVWHLFRGVGSRGPGGSSPPPDFADIDEKTEAEIDYL